MDEIVLMRSPSDAVPSPSQSYQQNATPHPTSVNPAVSSAEAHAANLNDSASNNGQPPRKKARKAPGSLSSEASVGQAGSIHPSSPASTHATLPSTRPENLTTSELAAVAALAMHANHQSSFMHSAQLDTDTLEQHAHPSHGTPALGTKHSPAVRKGDPRQPGRASRGSHAASSAVPLTAVYDSNGNNAYGANLSGQQSMAGVAGDTELESFRESLRLECLQAKETISRLQDFLARSESVLKRLDDRIDSSKAAKPSSTTAPRNPTDHPAPPIASRPGSATLRPPPPAVNEDVIMEGSGQDGAVDHLQNLLDSIPPSPAQPSALLKRRKREGTSSANKLFAINPTKAVPLRPRQKPTPFNAVWEICPPNAGVTVVAANTQTVHSHA